MKSHDEEKIESIKLAIQKLILDNKNKTDDNQDHQVILSRLLSQLEALEGNGTLDQAVATSLSKEATIPDGDVDPKNENADKEECRTSESNVEEIAKEIKNLKRQNLITHCLLSAMIILTVTWQLSEVSLLLRLKDGVRHPFRSLGSMLKCMLKKPAENVQDAEKELSSRAQQSIEAYSLPQLKIPDLPHVEMPEIDFSLNGDKH